MTNEKNERKNIIKDLHKLADEVLKLKEDHRQKRPIVIEFSGSPKSGKSSCINSLELFLKRNDFRVEIIQERANICPVYDKQSPMFNLWTSCMSLSGMIGVLDRKDINCDVLILDRGIFDALCWFDWLSEKKLMEIQQKVILENFLLIDTIVKRIDIVFAFRATPDISIEREYANLLTDKPGTIMNKKVLSEYLNSIKRTINDKKQYFHSIFEIDTSNKNQDEVGKEVTDKTLDTLKGLLVEKIGYFTPTSKQVVKLSEHRIMSFDEKEISEMANKIQFGLRHEIEKNVKYIQPIPIAVITNKERDKILTIKKTPKAVTNDSPEKDKLLVYIGGHSRLEDTTEISSSNFLSICKYTLQREVKEEIGISLALNDIIPFVIYTPDSEKSKKHIAICFLIEIDIDSIKLRLDPQELVLNKGTTKSGRFQDVKSLEENSSELESWGVEILQKCFNINILLSNIQLNLFDL